MVLLGTLEETLKSLNGNDSGKYLEERQLLNQLIKVLEFENTYAIYLRYRKALLSKSIDPAIVSEAVWRKIQEKLYDTIPDQGMAINYKRLFEDESIKATPNRRIASLQTDSIDYFTEKIKRDVMDGSFKDQDVRDFSTNLIRPGDVVLEQADNNIGLDESIEHFEMRMAEAEELRKSLSVK